MQNCCNWFLFVLSTSQLGTSGRRQSASQRLQLLLKHSTCAIFFTQVCCFCEKPEYLEKNPQTTGEINYEESLA